MGRLKTGMLVSAAVRFASTELIDCVVVRRGDADAGAIFVHLDALDGRHCLLARSLDFDGHYSWRSVIAGDSSDGWTDEATVQGRLTREMEIDPDAWIIAVQDSRARNPFDMI